MVEPVHFEIRIPSCTTDGLSVQEQLIGFMDLFEYSMRDIFAMRLSLEEAITNAIRHGNRLDPDKTVQVLCRIDSTQMEVVVTDQGEGFNPETVPDPTLEEFIERPSGRGLMLMRAYLSVCEYGDGGRQITMVRHRNSLLPIVQD
ncbi:MAG: ATP-binding protein [Planctomycetia bacterium]|jgi:serine/threonine-protein kinase RsbW